jgi:hypothetical protein
VIDTDVNTGAVVVIVALPDSPSLVGPGGVVGPTSLPPQARARRVLAKLRQRTLARCRSDLPFPIVIGVPHCLAASLADNERMRAAQRHRAAPLALLAGKGFVPIWTDVA